MFINPTSTMYQVLNWFPSRTKADGTGTSTRSRITGLSAERIDGELSLAITRDAYETIRKTIGARKAETGAVLGGNRSSGVITHVFLDESAAVTAVTYIPDIAAVNRLLREEWDPAGIDFMGFVHSHPGGYGRPSLGDQIYAERILGALPKLDRMMMPIVQTEPDTGSFAMRGFAAVRNNGTHTQQPGGTVSLLEAPVVIVEQTPRHRTYGQNAFLERVANSYDPAVMATTRIIAVGVGGSVGYLETMARAGIGQFVLIDPDRIEAKNVGTQAVDPNDIGKPKVAALAHRLSRLNPQCRVWMIRAKESAISDTGFHRLIRESLPGFPDEIPALTLLCAFTDNFPGQDRVQRLGLHFGVPTLAAGVFAEGRGTSITFAAPGLTRACIRCAQSSRYRAYLSEGYVNNVTSDGTPLLATDRLNSTKQIVTLALLHTLSPAAQHDHSATVRWRRAMERLTNRNLALTRLDPDSSLPSFRPLEQVTDGRCVMDETVWTMPTPDGADSTSGPCPDCGGTGDLHDSIGAFSDTRVLTTAYGQNRRGGAH